MGTNAVRASDAPIAGVLLSGFASIWMSSPGCSRITDRHARRPIQIAQAREALATEHCVDGRADLHERSEAVGTPNASAVATRESARLVPVGSSEARYGTRGATLKAIRPIPVPAPDPLVRCRARDAQRGRGLAHRPAHVCGSLHQQEEPQGSELRTPMSHGSLPKESGILPSHIALERPSSLNDLFGNNN